MHKIRRVEQAGDLVCERPRIAGNEQQARIPVADDFGQAAGVGDDHRAAETQRLDGRVPKGLITRGDDRDQPAPPKRIDRLGRLLSVDDDPFADVRIRNTMVEKRVEMDQLARLIEKAPIGPDEIECERRPGARQERERVEHHVAPFVPIKAADEDEAVPVAIVQIPSWAAQSAIDRRRNDLRVLERQSVVRTRLLQRVA